MPELPEVETVVRTLERQIHDLRIEDVEVIYPKMIDERSTTFRKKLIGQHFRQFGRRGKYILFYLDDCVLVSHLRMEGKYYIQDPEEIRDRHMHVIFHLSNGKELRYRDTRKFGRMEIISNDIDLDTFHSLGPEPFDDVFNVDYFKAYVKRKKSLAIKSLLLDQHFVVGIGNIYADEILFATKIRPGRNCKRLTKNEMGNIIQETRRILKEAIKAGGTTIRSYTSSLGVTGLFQLSCMVHEQKECKICGEEIKVKWIGGRSSYYCPNCQRK